MRVMTDDQVKAVLERISRWPPERQQELAELALEIEAEIVGTPYHASVDELRAIDEGLADGPTSEEDVKAVFAKFRSA
jgi:hypothetical protein